ncbi:hypothetical protein X975_23484, partial [Stegodyphus mimosarum]
MKYAISLLIPDVPTWVKNSLKKERYLVSYLMKRSKPDLEKLSQKPQVSGKNGEDSRSGDIQLNIMEKNGEGSLPKSRWSYG